MERSLFKESKVNNFVKRDLSVQRALRAKDPPPFIEDFAEKDQHVGRFSVLKARKIPREIPAYLRPDHSEGGR